MALRFPVITGLRFAHVHDGPPVGVVCLQLAPRSRCAHPGSAVAHVRRSDFGCLSTGLHRQRYRSVGIGWDCDHSRQALATLSQGARPRWRQRTEPFLQLIASPRRLDQLTLDQHQMRTNKVISSEVLVHVRVSICNFIEVGSEHVKSVLCGSHTKLMSVGTDFVDDWLEFGP